MNIKIVGMDIEGLGRLVGTSRQYELTAYDAAYLDLALRESLPLATLDRKLAEAARMAGVATFAA